MLRLRLPWLAFGFGLMVAQAAPAQPQGGRSAAAEALFSDGIELATAGKYAAALDKLRASYELEAARGTLQAIGLAEERSGKLASAYATYVKLRDLSQQAGDASRLEYARERLRAIAAKLARIVIQPGRMPADAKLFMDDVPLPLASAETAMPVNAGRHELKVESEGREVWSEIFTVRDGEKRTLRIDVVLPSKRQTSPPRFASTRGGRLESDDASGWPSHRGSWGVGSWDRHISFLRRTLGGRRSCEAMPWRYLPDI